MTRLLSWTILAMVVAVAPVLAGEAGPTVRADAQTPAAAVPSAAQAARPAPARPPIALYAATLGDHIDQFAGLPVHVQSARVVGLFGPRALLVESALRGQTRKPTRILVLLDSDLRASADQLVGRTVRVVGVARTLLGLQVAGDAPWPAQLSDRRIRRHDVRGAVVASALQTAEGVSLTTR